MLASAPPVPTVDFAPARAALLERHGDERARIERGLAQVAALWTADDGDAVALRNLAVAQFVPTKDLDALFLRFERALEQIDGHLLEVGRELRAPVELDLATFTPRHPVDGLFAGWDVSAHVTDDLFRTKIAFVALLNFPLTSLQDRLRAPLARRDWAVARLMGRVARRVPAAVKAEAAAAGAAADAYIADYNLWMHHVLDDKGARVFPRDKRLISHWNLRDELKAQYSQGADGTNRQRVIVRLMERIVDQTIPASVINAPWLDYQPFTNAVALAPGDTAERAAPGLVGTGTLAELEVPTSRYQQLLAQFRAARAADPYAPATPTAIARAFELGRELPEARVEQLFTDVLTSPIVPKVAKVIERRLGRRLEPHDLWYDGFKARASLDEAKLDALTRSRYPDAAAFKADLPRILRELGFSAARAQRLADHIAVDPARGAGHAMQAARRGDLPRLRTRIEPGGMDYKGYNIAVHELGHNVEQVISLYDVDSTLLAGVPNNAFTEAIAFVFQARDLELLGQAPSADARAQRAEAALADFWSTWEIAGTAIVDVAVWRWLYAHPDATPKELRDAVVQIAGDVWKKHYAPVLGGVDKQGKATPLLAIYSHMIAYPLYLADYPLGHLIALQIEEQIDKAVAKGEGTLGTELERMCTVGAVAPDVWMTAATGQPISAKPLLRAAQRALVTLAASSPPVSTSKTTTPKR